jgi:Sulfatase
MNSNAFSRQWRGAALAMFSLLLLNAMLSMTNLWPTPFVKLDARIAPDFIFVWCALLVWVFFKRVYPQLGLRLFTLVFFLLVLGRYFDTTAPALFGRAINLYWDGLQVPRLIWVMFREQPLWLFALVVLGGLLFLVLLWRMIRWSMTKASDVAAPYCLKHPWALLVTVFLLASSIGNLLGVAATWPYISRPVIPTYWGQAKVLLAAIGERKGESSLPASPPFVSDLGQLKGLDFKLFFFESYGAVSFDKPEIFSVLKPEYEALQAQLSASGRFAASAFVTSTTFGGGTDLAHMAFLTGIDTRDPTRHDILLTTRRPTLVSHFKSKGFETFGFYPGLFWEWHESAFFGFDHLIDGPTLKYPGPQLGYWRIPDQYAVARFLELYPVTPQSRPRFEFFSSSTSHFPFNPIPPYQPDWKKVLGPVPFDPGEVGRLQAASTDWLNMVKGYAGMIQYNLKWLQGYFEQKQARDFVMLVIGDHQPASNVTGEGAPWDVPVHLIASRPELIERFISMGFTRGLQANRKPIATLPELTTLLLEALDSRPGSAPRRSEATVSQ